MLRNMRLKTCYSRYFAKNVLGMLDKRWCSATTATDQEQCDALAEQTQRSLRIAVVGVPNSGKSTFINQMTNQRVCPISPKPHTTLETHKGICTEREFRTQLVYFDTPGLITASEAKKYNLGAHFVRGHRHAIHQADVMAVLHDVSNRWTRNSLHSPILAALREHPKIPSILILNKVDLVKAKHELLRLTTMLTNGKLGSKDLEKRTQYELTNRTGEEERGWSNFSNVFYVSALNGDGLDDIHDYFLSQAKAREWAYPSDVHTDRTPEAFIVDSVRARLLEELPQEVPYSLKCYLEYYAVEKDVTYASVQVSCPKNRLLRLICGDNDGRLRCITERVTSDLIDRFKRPVSLTITTKFLEKPKK